MAPKSSTKQGTTEVVSSPLWVGEGGGDVGTPKVQVDSDRLAELLDNWNRARPVKANICCHGQLVGQCEACRGSR